MSDFFLDLRRTEQRTCDTAAEHFRYHEGMRIARIERSAFSLVISRADDPCLWGPYCEPQDNLLVALIGRVTFDEPEWELAGHLPGPGGVACKAIALRYRREGVQGLRGLSGNFIVVLHDPALQQLMLVTDRLGMVPLFHAEADGASVLCSHPDLLAAAANLKDDLDMTSLAEFVSTGRVSFPYTYYRGVRSLDHGAIHTVNLHGDQPDTVRSSRYFALTFEPGRQGATEAAAERLADAFRRAVKRRTLARLGPCAVSLSGGLDSRMILCAIPDGVAASAFCFFDEQNYEFRVARQIAETRGVPFMPIRRDPEHYGLTAEAGVRIHGGTSSLANNHFLGLRAALVGAGYSNILTGFYCDYLFKGLALDRQRARWFQNARPGPYSHEWYRPVFPLMSPLGARVRERLDETFPPARRRFTTDTDRLWMEGTRLFPLSHEPDAVEALVPQRTMGWAPPIADNELLDIYSTLSVSAKLSQSVYARAVELICGPAVSGIPDSNTGARVNARGLDRLSRYAVRGLRNRYDRHVRSRLATSGSWPNWDYYVHHSPVVLRLWNRDQPEANDLISTIMGRPLDARFIDACNGRDVELFVRMLTLKIWMRGRIAGN